MEGGGLGTLPPPLSTLYPGPMSDAVTDLFTAIHASNVEGVRLLIGAEPALLHSRSPSGLSPVLFAAYYHRPYVLDVLLAAGPELDVFEAAATGRPLPEGADVNALNADGFTPLHLAALFGRLETAALLLERGADLHAVSRNPQAAQPLHSALGGRHWALARWLLTQGADANAAQAGGWTPLLLAVREGDRDTVAALLTQGAQASARTEDGQSAADLARENGHEELLRQFPVLVEPT